jgi:serine protease inhibitor
MKTIAGILSLVSLLVFTTDCKREEKQEEAGTVKAQLKSAQLVSASNKFGINLFKTVQQQDTGNNLFISPFSAMEALSMTYNGANGVTESEMADVLGFSGYTDTEINEYNQSLTNALVSADVKVQFEVANSIWYDSGFTVLQSFIDINKKYYDAEVASLDFDSPDAVNTINGWVSDKTHGKILSIIDAIPDYVVMYLINAIYFKGTWQYQFDKSKTMSAGFYLEDGSIVNHQQMAMEAEINYYEDEDFQAVELPYNNGTFNFRILLPRSGKNVNDLVSDIDYIKWAEIKGSMSKTKVVVKIPKFKFEMYYLLNDPLINMGMVSAFGNADFSGIDGYYDLYISRVIHKTFIDLNEEGTEAAAVTAVEIGELSAAPVNDDKVKYLIANKPFAFAITEKSTGAILFIGKMADPTDEKVEIQ